MLDKGDLKQIDNLLKKRVKEGVDSALSRELKPIKDDITHIRKDMKTIINYFDREYLELRGRVERIEEYLKISVV